MGRPKLTLPLQGEPLIVRLLRTLEIDDLTATAVVVRRDDAAVQSHVQQTAARLVLPAIDPPDMRSSVQYGLEYLRDEFSPADKDGWLLMPADHPLLNRELLLRLIHNWQETTADILVPTFEGKRGHPTFFRWSLAEAVFQLPADCGLNVLLRQFAETVQEVPLPDRAVLTDLDTPDDWERLQRSVEG